MIASIGPAGQSLQPVAADNLQGHFPRRVLSATKHNDGFESIADFCGAWPKAYAEERYCGAQSHYTREPSPIASPTGEKIETRSDFFASGSPK
jgi:hypothetical protein